MTRKGLHLAEVLTLPLDTITDTIGILAIKGAGKSYTSMVLVEEMVRNRFPVVVIDPVGVFWGLRQGVDGDPKKGLDVLILGGRNGDVPLEATAGKVIADFVIAERRPVILDTSAFETKADQLRFIKDFATRLYHANREAIHVVIDEADDVAPQKPLGKEEPFTLRAIEVLVRRGRARGIGVTLITQRSAAINKGVLTQVSTLILGRTVSPQDRKSIKAWIDAHATIEQHDACMESLASLPTNEKWVWSPLRDVFQRVKIRDRITFDSSATPKMGAHVAAPTLAPIDIEALKDRIASTIEKAKADDPRELRAKIKALETKLRAAAAPSTAPTPKTVEVPTISKSDLRDLKKMIETADKASASAEKASTSFGMLAAELRDVATRLRQGIDRAFAPPSAKHSAALAIAAPVVRDAVARTKPNGAIAVDTGDWTPGKAERALLQVLATRDPKPTTIAQLSVLSGYSHRSSSFHNAIGKLRSQGAATKGSPVHITDFGREVAGPVDPLPTGDALVAHWTAQLGKAEGALLNAIVEAHPRELTKEELGETAGYSTSSSSFHNAIGKLRTLELVERGSHRLGAPLVEALS